MESPQGGDLSYGLSMRVTAAKCAESALDDEHHAPAKAEPVERILQSA